jgi:hypothetical protein
LLTRDAFRTVLAKPLVSSFTSARLLIVRAWFWLPAEAYNTKDKRRCLNAILDSGLENEHALLLLLLLDQRRPTSYKAAHRPLPTVAIRVIVRTRANHCSGQPDGDLRHPPARDGGAISASGQAQREICSTRDSRSY